MDENPSDSVGPPPESASPFGPPPTNAPTLVVSTENLRHCGAYFPYNDPQSNRGIGLSRAVVAPAESSVLVNLVRILISETAL